jgi:flagellar biosynthesis protein FlhG
MFDAAHDQATGLREMFEQPGLTVLPIAATRRGMGFRSLVLNVAGAFARNGQRVVVIDSGPAATGHSLGLRLQYDLADLLTGEREFNDVTVKAPDGIYLIKANKGLPEFIETAGDPVQLFLGFRRLDEPFDVAILAGNVPEVASMTRNEDELVFISSADSEALTATYADIKRAHGEHEQQAFRVILNRVDDEREGMIAFRRLAETARKFLGVSIEYGGAVLRDAAFIAADRAQRTIFNVAPAGDAAKRVADLVQSMQAWRLGRYALTEN